MSIKDNIAAVRARIARVSRDPGEITLVAVIKNIPLPQVFEALEAGITALGENRVQEAAARRAEIRKRFPAAALHMIGHLQRNKVRQALDMFDIIQSVDSERLVEEISRLARRGGVAVKPIPILIEVNTSGEFSKIGVAVEKAVDMIRFASSRENIAVRGLMTLGPLTEDRELVRAGFRRLRELRDQANGLDLPGVEMKYLSMGMSADFETAIEEGSNLVRLGRAIFKGEG